MQNLSDINGVIEPRNPAKRERALLRLSAIRSKYCPSVGENGSALAVTAPAEPGQRTGTIPLSRGAVIFVDATEFFSPCGQRITARVRIDCAPFSVGYPADRRIVESILLAALSHSCVGA